MSYIVIALTSAIVSLLTFYSGFGLGTLLMPVFAIFFPLDAAIAMTAVVHLLNNLFKLALVGKHANRRIIVRFGLPAIVAAFIGARLLLTVSSYPALARFELLGARIEILPVKLTIAVLMIAFALLELLPKLRDLEFDQRYLVLGGLLSGFFGGLSGHQGALRSAFLVRAGLSKQAFVATGTVIAILIDFSRLGVYSGHVMTARLTENAGLLVVAVLSAFAGAYIGNRTLKKITMKFVQITVSAGLFMLAVALGLGVI